MDESRTIATEWRNWSGSVHAQPARVERPRDERELCQVVRSARKIRVVGAGHSFSPLCDTQATLLDLRAIEGSLELSPTGDSAWVPASWTLQRVTETLWRAGRSLANQGDIDTQSVAGALATGTHGTGADLPCLSTFARAFQIVLADGSLIECSPETRPLLFEAQRLSLGLLGVVVRVQIGVVPAYRLRERIDGVAWNEVVETYDQLAAEHRHAEFWVYPYSDRVILKTLDCTTTAERPEPAPNDEEIFRFICETTAQFPQTALPLQRMLTGLVRSRKRSGPAHEIFPTKRNVRFEEMEYEVPRAAGLAALQEARRWIQEQELPVPFPFEYRCTAGDEIWLSPFNKGPVGNISAHQYAKLPWQALFRDLEDIFRAHGGRPHWGKRHSLTAEDVFQLYPKAADFCAVRADADPEAKFANPYLTQLLALG
ncbi:MAG: FAD-binding protein [Myxococcales bacterium]|nr:FAD-binding protein [Myxococcales bacterium]MDD9970455.1 FAD-binding protein [Myxococcales bacterium]